MRKFFLLMVVAAMSLTMSANDKLSAPTLSFLHQLASGTAQNHDPHHPFVKSKAVNGVETIDCFITLNSMQIAELESAGVIVTGEYDGIVSAMIPINIIEEVANLKCVNQIAIARQVHHLSDKAKTITKAENAWNGLNNGLTQAFTGQNVVLGVIDGGIEFNHIAFKDANGNSRVKVAYLPNATSGGSAASVNGISFSGRQYTGSQLSSITTDDTSESHGTHTSGCAGASTIGGYSGMAPDADLVLCGLGAYMSETAITNSAKYIANYAKSVGKPCVISISLGSNMGPHDGKSSICRVLDQIANQFGAVILLASGNEADATGYATKTLSSDSDVMTIIHEGKTAYGSISGNLGSNAAIDIWNSTTDVMTVKVMVVNKTTGAVLYTSDPISSGTITTSQMGTTYFSNVNIQIYNSTSFGRRELYINPTVSGVKNSAYRIVYAISGKSGNKIEAWTDGGYYSTIASTGTVSGYTVTRGTADGTMTDDICGARTISVGAMCSRLSTPKNSFSNSPYSLNDVAYFSSFGTDFSGNNHPYITAPGHAVIAPINKYDTGNYSSAYLNYCEYNTTLFGQKDYWDAYSGTSMATPIAAGVVALYLQADPTLNVDGIKDVIAHSATAYANPQSPDKQRGHGIINALAGIQYILQQSSAPRIEVSNTELSMSGYVGDTITTTVDLKGYNLTQGATVSVVGPSIYKVEPTSISNANLLAGTTLTIKFIPTAAGNTQATINVASAGAQTVSISVAGVAEPKTPTLTLNPTSLEMSTWAGSETTKTFRVYGMFLDGDVNITSDNEMFTVTPSTIAASEFDENSYVIVTATYAPTAAGTHTGNITVSSTGAQSQTLTATGTASINIVAPHATDATGITNTSFTANWEPCLFATSYTLRIQKAIDATSLMTETFAKCTKESTTNIANSVNNFTDNAGWAGSYIYQAVGGIRLGSTSYNGLLQSPAIDLSGSNGKVSVKFTARAYDTDVDCPLQVSCGESSETITVPSSNEGSYIVALDCTQEAGQKIRFATTVKKKRVVITSVEIYDVDLTDTSSSGEPIIIEGINTTQKVVNGLTPSTAYTYDVMALYGTQQSNWSNMIDVTTLAEGTALQGDVNGDGFVTSADVTALYNFLLAGDMSAIVNGDQDGDGNITSTDVTLVYTVLLTQSKN